MKKSNIFEVFEDRNRLYTKNLSKGAVYGERIVREKGVEYREWDVKKSKLAASITKGSPNIGIRNGDKVLYLGCSTGTTVSHVSDIIGEDGFLFGIDSAARVLRQFVFLCERRNNITALMQDAAHPEEYVDKVFEVDILYQDVAQRNQVEIFLKNKNLFLKKGGYGLLCIKSRSIDVSKKPKDIFKVVRKELEQNMTIIDQRILDPFQRDHCMFICKN